MALVDYPSDSDSETNPKANKQASSEPPAKRAKPNPSASAAEARPSLVLPRAFYDLYASSVKTFDAPSLHQGRKRQTRHLAGRWPSHLYIEWRPPPAVQALLVEFLASLREEASVGQQGFELFSLLEGDLGIPQPLHISLSRPLSLPTADKDVFLERVQAAVSGGMRRMAPFRVVCRGVEWHHTAESGRSFLVLRVASVAEHDAKEEKSGENGASPELTELLARFNALAREVGQPELYQFADPTTVHEAFHLSIAWSFLEPTEALRQQTAHIFKPSRFQVAMQDVQIEVDAVKAKIGNVVTNIPFLA